MTVIENQMMVALSSVKLSQSIPAFKIQEDCQFATNVETGNYLTKKNVTMEILMIIKDVNLIVLEYFLDGHANLSTI